MPSSFLRWWKTMPGILTALGTVIGASATLLAIFVTPPTPTPRDKPGASPAIATDKVFAELLATHPHDLLPRLGAPLSPPSKAKITLQHFTTGWMLWDSRRDEILVCFNDDRRWERMSNPSVPVAELQARLASATDPRRKHFAPWLDGFLRVWIKDGLEQRLGWPEVDALELSGTVAQQFQHGQLIREFPFFEPAVPAYKNAATDPRWVLALVGTADQGDWRWVR